MPEKFRQSQSAEAFQLKGGYPNAREGQVTAFEKMIKQDIARMKTGTIESAKAVIAKNAAERAEARFRDRYSY